MIEPELFAETTAAGATHWLRRISMVATMPQWVSDQIPDEPADWMNWLINAASLAKIYADCALAPPPRPIAEPVQHEDTRR